ncbi:MULTISPECIES: YfhO family protein [unclassified Pseudoxanthomonas]|uniref:YfhO family protein n=1 Tax=unclassified Pseudoxanthomonas TaxID=2645906 RepID=UPI0008EAEF9D|nr:MULTISPECIES: YfhO family protein [unclassified Pseudoxanthomonas]PPJ41540.1 hypothetical protein C0063_17085 [Pseudoxanthomonas sp. KAs_5_3]SFV29977.1 membrane protein YfhO [Pseudoxanthomonas sp. YR558]
MSAPQQTRWTYAARGDEAPRSKRRIGTWLLLALCFIAFYAIYFSPALLKHVLLAPGDGEIYYLPLFRLPITEFWNDLILSGYPVAFDIQAMTLYPLRWLSPTFNTLVISAYVVAALGMYGLCRKLTGSRLGALTGALVASGSGFMLGHLGHLTIIHAAAWMPWMLWAVLAARDASWRPVALGAAAVAMCVYGGHPQLTVISLLFSGSYALFLAVATAREVEWNIALRYLLRITVLFAAGLLLAAPALVGLLDSAGQSVRAAWSINDFASFSHDFLSLRLLWFPNLYGVYGPGPYGYYSGPFNLTELALYAGIGSWMLASLAVTAFHRKFAIWFWVGGVVAGLLLALGTATPLGELVYRLPVLGKFRAQARFGWILIVSLSVLAAYGVAAVMGGRLQARGRWGAWIVSLVGLSLAAASVMAALPDNLLAHVGGALSAPNVVIPLVLIAATALLCAFWLHRPGHGRFAMLLVLLVMDLASFGYYHDWKYSIAVADSVSPARYAPPPPALTRGDGRVLPFGANEWPAQTLRPNVNMHFGVPSAIGYGPLLSARYAQVTGTDPTGSFPRVPLDAPILDVLGVRWIAGDLVNSDPQLLGGGCGVAVPKASAAFVVPEGTQVDQVRVVSHMACSEALKDGTPVATLDVIATDGAEIAALPVEVGRDTGEWAHDRTDLVGVIAHRRPPIADSFDAGGFQGHNYEGAWSVEPGFPARIEIDVVPGGKAPLKVVQVQVRDARSGMWQSLASADAGVVRPPALSQPLAWGGETAIRERHDYRSMAWVACKTQQADLPAIAKVLSASRNDTGFDPFTTVLTEKRLILPSACQQGASADIVERRNGYWRIRTQTDGPGVLVVSSAYHHGWVAEMGGRSLSVIPADGILLGVPVGTGSHEIVLRFRPRNFTVALWMSGATLASLAVMLAWGFRRRREGIQTKQGQS